MPPRRHVFPTRAIPSTVQPKPTWRYLHDRGIEYFFGNGEPNFAPLVEAFAKSTSQGSSTPKPITVPHEHGVRDCQ